ncbi:MAG: flagellar biosynthetic protein FliQ [Pseudomonadota bacterium]
MDEGQLIDLMRQAAWVGIVISTPILVVALVTGIAIGLLQALTAVQELTLTFVPKLVAILIVFVATAGFMIAQLVDLFHDSILPGVTGI